MWENQKVISSDVSGEVGQSSVIGVAGGVSLWLEPLFSRAQTLSSFAETKLSMSMVKDYQTDSAQIFRLKTMDFSSILEISLLMRSLE